MPISIKDFEPGDFPFFALPIGSKFKLKNKDSTIYRKISHTTYEVFKSAEYLWAIPKETFVKVYEPLEVITLEGTDSVKIL